MMNDSRVRSGLLILCASVSVALSGCGSSGSESSDEELGTQYAPLVAGTNAAFVSSTVPVAMAPGERRSVNVVMQNNGSVPASNTWTVAGGYVLYRTNSLWGWTSTPVSTSVPVGSNETFNFVITAPATPGTHNFGSQMRVLGDSLFGAQLNRAVVVSNATQRMWSCTFVPGMSTVPTTLAPNENRVITVVLQNTGTATWPANGFYLKTQDTPSSLWSQTSSALASAVAPNATTTFSFNIKAPAAFGTYSLKRQMIDTTAGGVGFFDLSNSCLNASITVAGPTVLDAALTSQDFPITIAPGESRTVTVTMRNTGTETWANDANYALYSTNSPTSLWSATSANVATSTATSADATMSLVITAPAAPGSYFHQWRMRKFSGAGAGFFGASINVPVTVDASATPQYGATVISQNIPTKVTAGEATTFAVTMANSGTTSWTGSSFSLASTNAPSGLWSVASTALGGAETVAASAQRLFSFSVTAPATPGTYASHWRMRQLNGVGFFGEEAITSGVEVTLCGNGTVDGGEACDDNNLLNGDGCSDSCVVDNSVVVDLATTTPSRTLVGSGLNKQLANVAIGDVDNNGSRDVVVGEGVNVSLSGQQVRNQAGAVYGYSGTGFFSNTSTAVPGTPLFTIYGARANDTLATHGSGGVLVGDVTGDGINDVVVSAGFSDGINNDRADAGEVYIIKGGAALTGNVVIDLAAVTPSASLGARILGATAGDQLVVAALGDLTGDGIADLVLGAPFNDAAGADAGAQYVVTGGAALATVGTIDLAAPTVTVATLTGVAAGDQLGRIAAVGNFGSTATADLLIGNSGEAGGGTRRGGAYGFFGPITGTKSLAAAVGSATGPSVKWLGAGDNDRLGGSVAVGDVLGSNVGDALIGAVQQRKGGLQFGAVNVFAGPVGAGQTINLGSTSGTATLLGADLKDNFGSAMTLGDWNNDGRLDMAVAALAGQGSGDTLVNAGELYVILGSPSLSGSIDLAVTAPAALIYGAAGSDQLGSRYNNIAFGDVDGDGRDDVCVGSHKGSAVPPAQGPGRVDCLMSQ